MKQRYRRPGSADGQKKGFRKTSSSETELTKLGAIGSPEEAVKITAKSKFVNH
jgi:hypothetical protein